MRKWGFKLLVGFVILLLAGIIGSFVYLIKARMQLVEFRFQIETIMTAASMAVDEWDLPKTESGETDTDGSVGTGGAAVDGAGRYRCCYGVRRVVEAVDKVEDQRQDYHYKD